MMQLLLLVIFAVLLTSSMALANIQFFDLPATEQVAWRPGDTVQFRFNADEDALNIIRSGNYRIYIDNTWRFKTKLSGVFVPSQPYPMFQVTFPNDIANSRFWYFKIERLSGIDLGTSQIFWISRNGNPALASNPQNPPAPQAAPVAPPPAPAPISPPSPAAPTAPQPASPNSPPAAAIPAIVQPPAPPPAAAAQQPSVVPPTNTLPENPTAVKKDDPSADPSNFESDLPVA